jgi:hypothetical protein
VIYCAHVQGYQVQPQLRDPRIGRYLHLDWIRIDAINCRRANLGKHDEWLWVGRAKATLLNAEFGMRNADCGIGETRIGETRIARIYTNEMDANKVGHSILRKGQMIFDRWRWRDRPAVGQKDFWSRMKVQNGRPVYEGMISRPAAPARTDCGRWSAPETF